MSCRLLLNALHFSSLPFPTLLLPQEHHLSRELPISWHLFKPHPFHVSFYNCHAHKTLSLNTLWCQCYFYHFYFLRQGLTVQPRLALNSWIILLPKFPKCWDYRQRAKYFSHWFLLYLLNFLPLQHKSSRKQYIFKNEHTMFHSNPTYRHWNLNFM